MELTAALDGAGTLARVDELARAFWGATGAGQIADADAERVSAHIEAARQRIRPRDTVAARAPGVQLAAFSRFPPRRRRCVSPNRLASRARRRELGLAGALPHALAARFTEGERAVLAIVAAETKATGACALALEAIAARAGVCITLARGAIRLAAAGGLALIIERRRPGRPSLTNVVKIVSREWRAWIWRRGGGCKLPNPTEEQGKKKQPETRTNGKGGATGQGDTGPRADDRGARRAGPASG